VRKSGSGKSLLKATAEETVQLDHVGRVLDRLVVASAVVGPAADADALRAGGVVAPPVAGCSKETGTGASFGLLVAAEATWTAWWMAW
jgi:hypothetical protein